MKKSNLVAMFVVLIIVTLAPRSLTQMSNTNVGVTTDNQDIPGLQAVDSKSIVHLLVEANYTGDGYREIVFVLPEAGCINKTQQVINYVNEQNEKKTTPLVIAKSELALRHGPRFENLRRTNTLFLKTEYSNRMGMYLERPLFIFIQNCMIIGQFPIGCASDFDMATKTCELFFSETESDANFNGQASR